jgi:hypothetical protein
MGVKVSNNAFGTLSASINTTDTTVTLDSGQGARFPALGASDHFYGTIVDTSNNIEIVKVTARSTDSMTVTRAQDNTTARSFAIGDRFELRPTAALFEDIYTEAVADSTPASNTITTAMIQNNAVTDAKLAATLDLSGKTMTYGLASTDMPSGTIVQVLHDKVSSTAQTISSTTPSSIGLTQAITTKVSNSKILVMAHNLIYDKGSSTPTLFAEQDLVRTISGSDTTLTSWTHNPYVATGQISGLIWAGAMNVYLDSPSQTAGTSITYDLKYYIRSGGASYDVNHNDVDTSSMIVMEIVA